MLVASVMLALLSLPTKISKALAGALLSDEERSMYSGQWLSCKVGSKLLGLTVYRVRSCYRRMKADNLQPKVARHW